jgi:hypothetical protein
MTTRLYVRDGVAYLLPDPAAFTSAEVQLAIGLRNEATLSGRCAVCGAGGLTRAERRRLGRDHQGEVGLLAFEHAADCPASDGRILEMLREEGERA